MKNQVKNFSQYIKESNEFEMENNEYTSGEMNLAELSDFLEDNGRTAMIIKGVLGGDRFLQTPEGEFTEGLMPIGKTETLSLDDIGIILDIFDTKMYGKKQKVVEITFMGPGSTSSPMYIYAA